MTEYIDNILEKEYKTFNEQYIQLNGQLTYAVNISDWEKTAHTLDQLGILFSKQAQVFKEAAKRRQDNMPFNPAVGIAILHHAEDFDSERLLAFRQRMQTWKGTIVFFVKKGIEFPSGYLDEIQWKSYRFADIDELNKQVSAFLGTTHWKHNEEKGTVEVFGHGAARLNEAMKNTQQGEAVHGRKNNKRCH